MTGKIDVNHVSFAYDGDLAVLHNVDLHVKPGETVAIVGPSGGGKSTLCQLIPRFYDVSSGSICIDGVDVRKVTQKSIHQNIGIVQQDVFLFADTIFENIRYGKPDATEEEVYEAAKKAEIYDDIPAMLGTALTPMWANEAPSCPVGKSSGYPSPEFFLKNPHPDFGRSNLRSGFRHRGQDSEL